MYIHVYVLMRDEKDIQVGSTHHDIQHVSVVVTMYVSLIVFVYIFVLC